MHVEEEINALKARNARVDREKAWEVSAIRRICLLTLIFCVAWAFLAFLGIERAAFMALVPTLGYGISTLSLGLIKRWWLGNPASF